MAPLADDEAAESITVLVEGVPERASVARIEREVRQAIVDARLAGRWVVAIAPSELRGHWDVGLRGQHARHVFSFVATERQMPSVIGDHVRRAVERMRPLA